MTSSGSPTVLHSDEGVIETSYSCVVVRGNDLGDLISVAPADNTLVTVPPPDDEDGSSDLWVQTADQWGPFSVTTRLWDMAPPDAGEEWEDFVEVSVTSTTGLSATELVDNVPQIVLTPEPGQYRVRISARGRRVRDLDQADDLDDLDDLDADLPPKEWYLLEAWSAPPTDPTVVRLTSPYAAQVLNPPPRLVIPEGEAGLAAAARIGRDVDGTPGARTLSGKTGSVRVERTIRGTRRRLFNLCAHVGSWSHVWLGLPSWSHMSGPGWDKAGGTETWTYSDDSRDQLTGHGAVRTRFLVLESPSRAVKTWNWVRRVGDRGPSPLLPESANDVLAEDSTFSVDLAQSRDDEGEPRTTITITHEGLPVEWLDDMETYWAYQLSIADHAGLGVPT